MNNLVSYSESSSDDGEENPENETHKTVNSASVKRRASGDDHDHSESSDSTSILVPPPSKKRCSDNGPDDELVVSEKRNHEFTSTGLPLPGAIMCMFEDKHKRRDKTDDPEQHGGRIRSFPHMEGNWASFVYIPVSPDERFNSLIDMLLLCLRPLNFERMDDLHVSLSRTVCIRHHWIQPLTDSLKESFLQLDSCLCDVGPVKVYTNDEKTRTFFSLEIKAEETNLKEYVSAVDTCFREFNLPGFYENPSFHISLIWCVGDVLSRITEKTKEEIQRLTRDFFSRHTDLSVVLVNQVRLKTGNKTFAFHLQNVDE